jgi:hypothetical protein
LLQEQFIGRREKFLRLELAVLIPFISTLVEVKTPVVVEIVLAAREQQLVEILVAVTVALHTLIMLAVVARVVTLEMVATTVLMALVAAEALVVVEVLSWVEAVALVCWGKVLTALEAALAVQEAEAVLVALMVVQAQAEDIPLVVACTAVALAEITPTLVISALALVVQFASFGLLVVFLAHSLQLIREIYKWNFLFASKTANRLSIQFLATTSAKRFLM